MSLVALSLAIPAKTNDPLAKLILLLLADRHNADTGECHPSIARICADSEISRSTVIRKIELLQNLGLIAVQRRSNPDGTRALNHYELLFVPKPAKIEKEPRKTARLVEEDWWPSDAAIAKIKERYPHHETGSDTIEYLVREFIQWCHAAGKRYIDHEKAWLNSAERAYRRLNAGGDPRSKGKPRANRSLADAVRRF